MLEPSQDIPLVLLVSRAVEPTMQTRFPLFPLKFWILTYIYISMDACMWQGNIMLPLKGCETTILRAAWGLSVQKQEAAAALEALLPSILARACAKVALSASILCSVQPLARLCAMWRFIRPLSDQRDFRGYSYLVDGEPTA